jgi:alpha-L-fucosidase
LLPDGTLDSQEESILQEITNWMAVHGEAIFSTRPWKVYGEGPSTAATSNIDERKMKPFSAADLRFTAKGDKLFLFVLGVPQSGIHVQSFGKAARLWDRKISNLRILGSEEKAVWSMDAAGLHIRRPRRQPNPYTLAFELS